MVKRYFGGVISSTARSVSSDGTAGVFETSNQLQEQNLENWPGTTPLSLEYIVVGGGGGGGGAHAGGAGAGGFLSSSNYPIQLPSQVTVVVGAGGGAGGRGGNGANGTESSIVTQSIVGNSASWLFNGTNSDLTIPSSANLNLGGTFTIELWFYRTSGTGEASLFQKGEHDYRLTTASTGVGWYVNTFPALSISVSTTINNNTWYHVAVCSDGTTVRIFLNGVQGGSAATNIISSGNSVFVGVNSASVGKVWYFPGYISGLRVLKGTALYTSNFTVPTSSLTNIPNTVLLITPAFSTTGTTVPTDATGQNSITVNGTVTLSALNPFLLPVNRVAAAGGGGGGSEYRAGSAGASGGGGATGAAGASGTAGQGNNGGTSSVSFAGGGGGGAGAAGGNTSGANAGNGGIGVQSSISGTATYYAGGGGGGSYGGNGNGRGTGGNGGGGNGNNGSGNGSAGTANTGGGGGGGGYPNEGAYAGGSGVVIVRYPAIYRKASNIIGSVNYTFVNGFRVYTFTTSGSVVI